MSDVTQWWGIKENIGVAEIAARSAVMFVIALLLLRLSGMRPFGKGENFDKIITFLIGAILSRGVVGATPFVSTIISMIVILLIHKIISRLSFYSQWFSKMIEGNRVVLFQNGKYELGNLRKIGITEKDLMEELRLTVQADSLEDISSVFMERTGELSFVKRKKQN